MNKEIEQTILTAIHKWAAKMFPKLPAFAHEQLGVAAVHVARAAEWVTAYVEEMEQAKGQAFRRLSDTEERLRSVEERYQQLVDVHNQVQECESLRGKLSLARHTVATLHEKLGDWTNEPCPGCLGAGKIKCKNLCAHPERDVCPCACHKPCQDCGGTGHLWLSWEDKYKAIKSLFEQQQQSKHKDSCPRHRNPDAACWC